MRFEIRPIFVYHHQSYVIIFFSATQLIKGCVAGVAFSLRPGLTFLIDNYSTAPARVSLEDMLRIIIKIWQNM